MTIYTGYAVDTVAALKLVATTDLPYGFQLSVKVKRRTYQYEPASTATGDDDNTIVPNSGLGRWIAMTAVSSSGGGSGGGGDADLSEIQAQIDEQASDIGALGTLVNGFAGAISDLQAVDSTIQYSITSLQDDKVDVDRFKDTLVSILDFQKTLTLGNGVFDAGTGTTSFFALPYSSSPPSQPEWMLTGLIRISGTIAQLQIPAEVPYVLDDYDSPAYKITLPGAVSNFSIQAIFTRIFGSKSTFVNDAYDDSGGS
jgi:hypothetical protein